MHFFTKNFHLINIPPLFTITLFFIIGIICHSALLLLCILFGAIACITGIAYTQKIQLSTQLTLCAFFACAGAYLHQQELRNYDDFYTFTENKKLTITGTIIDSAEVMTHNKKTTALTVNIDTIATENQTQKSNKIALFYIKSNKCLKVGDSVAFFNTSCKRPSSESFQRYQIKEQIVATIFDDSPNYIVLNHPTWSLRRWIWEQKTRLLHGLAQKLSPTGFRFFSSLFLGNRVCIKSELEETNEQFKIWGISHFLARSGLHLALFIFIWQAIFCVIPLPLFIKQIIIILLSCIYFLLTWTSAPFTRSFALFMLNKICLFTKTPFHLLHYLILVCFGFLLYCPLYLFFLDFQLSFALTFALAWFSQLTTQYAHK